MEKKNRGNPRPVFLLLLTKRFLLPLGCIDYSYFFQAHNSVLAALQECFMFVQNVEYLIIEDLCVLSKTLQTPESLLQPLLSTVMSLTSPW